MLIARLIGKLQAKMKVNGNIRVLLDGAEINNISFNCRIEEEKVKAYINIT